MTIRKCGECTVCCEQVWVKETDSPAGQPCKFQMVSPCGSCSIHNMSEQPQVCRSFHCAWMNGFGGDEIRHRPDQNGVMFSVSETPSGLFGFAMEYRPNALLTTAREMLIEFVCAIPFPVIVRGEEQKPPYDFGTGVVVKDSLYARCARRLIGPMREVITRDISLFDLKIEIPMERQNGSVYRSV